MSDKPEPLEGIWKDDLLERRKDAERIIRFVTAEVEERKRTKQPTSYVLNVDSAWGQGKTFFLKRLQDHLQFEGHKVALINAWEDDHGEDPLIPFVIELDKLFTAATHAEKNLTTAGVALLKTIIGAGGHIATSIANNTIGDLVTDPTTAVIAEGAAKAGKDAVEKTARKLIENLGKKRQSRDEFRALLKKISSQGRQAHLRPYR